MSWRSVLGLLLGLSVVLVATKKRHYVLKPILEDLEWGWDTWCHYQPKVGRCNASTVLYYFDTETARCRQFVFSGCDGNQNQFGSLKDCTQYCQEVSLNPEVKIATVADICQMQKNPGMCLAHKPQFYYDVNTKNCERFIYGGCGGNANRFSTKKACMEKCSNSGA